MPAKDRPGRRWLGQLRNFGASPVSLRFLGSYLLILIIPIVIFVFVLGNLFLARMERQAEHDNLLLTNTIGATITNAMESMRNIAHQISNSPALTTYHLTDSPLNASEGISQLANYTYGQHLIDDIALVCDKSPYVYTSRYAPKRTDFLSGITSGSLTGDMLYERFFTDAGALIPVNRNVDGIWTRQLMAILQEESSSSANRRAVLIFLSQARLDSILAVSDATVALYDSRNNPVADHGSGIVLPADAVASLVAAHPNGGIVPSDDEGIFVTAFRSRQLGVSLVMTKPRDATMGDVEAIKNRAFLILAAVFAAGLILIAYDMKTLYMPIYRLKQFAESAMGAGGRGNDEYEVLDRALNHFMIENHSMSARLETSRDLMRDKYVLSLLQGSSSRQGQLEQAERDSGIRFPYDSFCAMLILPAAATGRIGLILKGFESITEGPVILAGAPVNEGETMGLILNFDGSYECSLREYIRHLADSVAEQLGCRVTAGVGGICLRRTDIGRSHIEARTALDYRLIYGVGRVIFLSEIEQADESKAAAPYELMKRLEVALLDGNVEAASALTDQAIASLKQGGVSLGSARCFAYDMINTILRVIRISGTAVASDVLRKSVLADFETIDELAAAIKGTTDRLCGVIQANKARYSEGLLGNIRRYVDDNYLDYSFTVKRLAAEFGMSESNISHYYKNATGHNISDYINDLRIGKAKELLTGTDLSVREIVDRIGYSDVSSFTRKFRLTIGVSPGSYRNTYMGKA